MAVIVVFGGTIEGRMLAEAFRGSVLELHISVATEYGASLLPVCENIHIHAGRLDEKGMEAFLLEKKADYCVDATHPYAVEVTRNLRLACERTKVPYLRVRRGRGEHFEAYGSQNGHEREITFVNSVEEAARWLARTKEGNILITTGSKELAQYTIIPGYRDRCFARVLPTVSVMEACRELGFEGRNLIGMQGPFSEELNFAMLGQTDARFLVTKQSGIQGGYQEKCEAAIRAGAHILAVGRPEEETAGADGKSLEEVIDLLKGLQHGIQQYSTQQSDGELSGEESNPKQVRSWEPAEGQENRKRQVSLIGMGPGSPGCCTLEAEQYLADCDVIIGAGRILEICQELLKGPRERKETPMYDCYRGSEIAVILKEHPEYRKAAVVFSGDIGFYSGARSVKEYLRDYDVKMIPGIASPVYFLDKLGIPWDKVLLASRHGQDCDAAALLEGCERVCILLGKEGDIPDICKELLEHHMENVKITVGEHLSYPEERIVSGTPAELSDSRFDSLSIALLEQPDGEGTGRGFLEQCRKEEAGSDFSKQCSGQSKRWSGTEISNESGKNGASMTVPGIPDSYFIRGEVPMTKEEIRTVSLAKLHLTSESILYDVGAGTGSVSVEAALMYPRARVYAIERNPEGMDLIYKNREHFGTDNVEVIQGEAPEALEALEKPTHVFIGGSGGKLFSIVEAVRRKNPRARIVVNAITLETLNQLAQLREKYPEYKNMEIIQISVARSRTLGNYHMMMGENPIYIVSLQSEP